MKELIKIQSELKAPKGQTNTFGNYKYRNCEDILEALKPLLLENNCSVIITDDIVQIGERYYVKATATLKGETDSISVSAFAREAADKKGMDASQITGATSSYARKYALNGLFAIDDTKDADSADNTKKQTSAPATKPAVTPKIGEPICDICGKVMAISKKNGLPYCKHDNNVWGKPVKRVSPAEQKFDEELDRTRIAEEDLAKYGIM